MLLTRRKEGMKKNTHTQKREEKCVEKERRWKRTETHSFFVEGTLSSQPAVAEEPRAIYRDDD